MKKSAAASMRCVVFFVLLPSKTKEMVPGIIPILVATIKLINRTFAAPATYPTISKGA